MKRFVAVVAAVVLPLAGFAAPADATGYGICTITGTINFSSDTPSTGKWDIRTAVIDCQGIVAARRRIIGRGPFKGSGTFSAVAPGAGGCLQQVGTGNVEYRIPTSNGDILVREVIDHTVVGVGVFNTPSLHGVFELPPPYGGDCVTTAVGTSTFVAQVLLLRYRRVPNPVPPGV